MGREVSSAAAVASQSATCQLCVGSSVLGCGEMSVSVSAGLAKVNKIGCSMNKIGWFMKSKHRAGYTRCVPEQNPVVRGEHFLGAVIGAVLRG